MSSTEKRNWEQNEFDAAVTQVDAPPFDAQKFEEELLKQSRPSVLPQEVAALADHSQPNDIDEVGHREDLFLNPNLPKPDVIFEVSEHEESSVEACKISLRDKPKVCESSIEESLCAPGEEQLQPALTSGMNEDAPAVCGKRPQGPQQAERSLEVAAFVSTESVITDLLTHETSKTIRSDLSQQAREKESPVEEFHPPVQSTGSQRSSPDINENATQTELLSEPEQANTTPQIYSRCLEQSTFGTPLTAPLPYMGELSSKDVLLGKSSDSIGGRVDHEELGVPLGEFPGSQSQGSAPRAQSTTGDTPAVQNRISRIEEAFREPTLCSAPPRDSSVPLISSVAFDFQQIDPLSAEPRTPGGNKVQNATELYDTPADFNLSQLHFYTPGSTKPGLPVQKESSQLKDANSLLGELLGEAPLSPPENISPPGPEKTGTPARSENQDKLSVPSGTDSRKRSSPPGTNRARANLLCSDDEDSIAEEESSESSTLAKPTIGVHPKWEDFPEAYDVRPIAEGVSPDELEEYERHTIFVLHKGEVNIINWLADTPARDVREAILCACDAIADSGFLLRELLTLDKTELKELLGAEEDRVGGQLILVADGGKKVYYKRGEIFAFEDFHRLKRNGLYHLEIAKEREDLKSITGDRWRRLKIPINPLLHVEAQKAIKRMRQGTNLVKNTTLGLAHFRYFQLSADLKRLVWYTAGKPKDQSVIQMINVTQIKVDPKPVSASSAFPRSHNFTIIAGKDGTYQLAAKNEEEYDLWVAGLKALASWAHGELLNKAQLLSHCRRFKQALERRDLSVRIDEGADTSDFNMADFALHVSKKSDLLKKEMLLRRRLLTAQEKAKLIELDSLAKPAQSEEGPAQNMVGAALFTDDISDDQMEYQKMEELMTIVDSLLAETRGQLEAIRMKPLESDAALGLSLDGTKPHTDENLSPSTEEMAVSATTPAAAPSSDAKNACLVNAGRLLWKAEVEIENIEDILKRLSEPLYISVPKQLENMKNRAASLTKHVFSLFKSGGTGVVPIFFSGSDPAVPTTTPASHAEEMATEQTATSD